MHDARNPFMFDKPITLDSLDDLFSHHRRLTGGWSMEGASGGGSGDGGGAGGGDGSGGGQGGNAGGAGGQGGGSAGASGGGQGGRTNATDEQGNDLGYPKDTPIAEMSDKEQAAYWKNSARKHEGRVKGLVGERTPEEVKKDLEELAELKKAQQTPAEQQLTEAREQGKKEAISAERTKAATAIFRGALEANGVSGDDLEEIATNFNVAGYITDDGVDTTKITNFAKRFSSGKDTTQQRRRDFGGGQRRESSGNSERGSAGKAEAQRRFKKTNNAGE